MGRDIMRRAIHVPLVLLALLPLSSHACINDRDTLAEEVKGLPDVAQVITGRFERNPPLYYQMRLARVAAELKANPSLLPDYDDAGAACDRLGHDDEALAWMAQKHTQLAKLPQSSFNDPNIKEQWYRFYANDGTFRIHRWIRAGADRKHIAEVQQARDEIAQALKIKPDAHFGREKYQSQVMDWIVAGKPYTPLGYDLVADKDAIKGLCGLVALGNAWESVDIFNALAFQLRRPRFGFQNQLSYLARLRCEELIDQGQGSLMPDEPKGAALKRTLVPIFHARQDDDARLYHQLRAEAEKWQARRTAYMMARLTVGRHPDTDPTFWNNWHDPGPPSIPIPWDRRIWLALGRPLGDSNAFYSVMIVVGFLTILIGTPLLVSMMIRRSRRRQSTTHTSH